MFTVVVECKSVVRCFGSGAALGGWLTAIDLRVIIEASAITAHRCIARRVHKDALVNLAYVIYVYGRQLEI